MYDVIEQIEDTIGAPLLDDDRREILSAVVSNYNEGFSDGVASAASIAWTATLPSRE